jgi:GH25 family lysozyme M1 (1,4-beta-N-acetylmuramidase)
MSRRVPARTPTGPRCTTGSPDRGRFLRVLVVAVALFVASGASLIDGLASGGAAMAASGGGCAATAGLRSIGLGAVDTFTVGAADATAPGAATARGVDVSHWDGAASMASVGRSGAAFVYAKATQGRGIVDGTFAARVHAAAAAGLLSGAYHFFDYRVDGIAQARFFVSTVRRHGGFTGHLPPAVDVECLRALGRSSPGYAARQLRAFLGEVYRRTGRMAVIYTSPYMWHQVTGNDRSFGAYPLWVACWYCAHPTLPRGWTTWTFWQVGKVGIAGVRVDGDIFRGGRTTLRRARTATPRIAGGTRYVTRTSVHMSLRGRDGRWFRSSTDGRHWTHWRRYTAAATFQLRARDGRQRLYLQFRDPRGRRSPVTSDRVVLDRTGPVISLAPPRFAVGAIAAGRLPGTVSWRASDLTSGIAAARLTRTCDGEAAAVIAGTGTARTAGPASGWLVLRAGCELTVRARDRAGNVTTVRRAEPSVVFTSDEATDSLVYAGDWGVPSIPKAIGGIDHLAGAPDATATLMFTGSDIAIVSSRGPARGRAEVSIDGVAVGIVDLYATTNRYRVVVFTRHLADAGDHVLVVRVLGTHATRSIGSRVDIDGFLTLDASSFVAAE